jgi:uncharacterized membrane protein HdeD (DUF308 family)
MSRKIVTIEQTGKTWKMIQAAGVVLMLGGLVSLTQDWRTVCILCTPAGVLTYAVGRTGAWYYHG